MSSHNKNSATNMEGFVQNGESSAQIGDPENPQEQIQVLKRLIDQQAAEIIRLKKKVHASEQHSGVSNEAPADDTNDLPGEFELSGSAMEEREPQLEQRFKQLNTRENFLDFAEKYSTMEQEIASLKAKGNDQEKEISRLNAHCMRLAKWNVFHSLKVDQLEEEMQGRDKECGKDDEDGNNGAQYSENPKQVVPHEMVGFVDPFNCASSCGDSVVFFILYKMGLPPCNGKLIREMQNKANIKTGNCSSSLHYFVDVGVLEEEEIFSVEITEVYTIDSALEDAHGKIKDQSRPALLALEYENEEVGHCVAIMPDGSTFIDVQKKRYWKPQPDKQPVSHIHVVNVKENAPKDWIEKCGLHKCEDGSIVPNTLSGL